MAQVLNRYPIWKYLILLFLIVFGVFYAAPNLFPEDPAVQISSAGTMAVSQAQVDIVKSTLKTAKIDYKSIEFKNDKILVRLKDVDSELKAEELIEKAIGSDYTAAVNLVSATPKWLEKMGGHPMNLGLDLRGGVHFLLEVDVDSVIQKREKSDIQAIAKAMRTAGIRYSRLRPQKPTGLLIQFRNNEGLTQAERLLRKQFTDYQVAEINRANRTNDLQMSLQAAALTQLRDNTMKQTIQVLNNRVNALGVAEASVVRQGLNRIAVDLPGVQDTAQASKILGGNATLEMHLVNETADIASAQQGVVPAGSSFYRTIDGRPIVLKDPVILTGSAVTRASAGFDQNGKASVSITAVGPQVSEFHRITGQNIGSRMGIVLINAKTHREMVKGKEQRKVTKEAVVISDAVIQSALPGSFQVTGLTNLQMAKDLAIQLRSGTTPAALYPLQELLIGPSLGKANIEHGMWSVLAGFLFIVLFMLLYYRLFGLIANMALLLNLVVTIALMSLIGFTLSLPGIAGMVLAVGMAVDANVLIFERIREELRNGNTPQAAIHAGYERAFSTIVDSNVTTLIIAILLFAVATSTVKAFAITLIIGLSISMITAILGTRAMVNLIYGGRVVKNLSIGIKTKR